MGTKKTAHISVYIVNRLITYSLSPVVDDLNGLQLRT